MEPNAPKLTLCIITKNRKKYFQRSLTHAIKELATYPDAELIVIDGGSTDGTVEVLRENDAAIGRWISEPDKNVSDAVNKALRIARGQVIRMIGDDDILVPNSVAPMMQYLDEHPEIDVLAGHNTIFYEEDDGTTRPYGPMPKSSGAMTKERMGKFFYEELFIPECAYFRMSVFKRYGEYNLRFHWYSFWEYLCRIVEGGGQIHVLPLQVVTSYQTPLSDTRRGCDSPVAWKERLEIARHYGGWRWVWYQRFGPRPSLVTVARWFAAWISDKLGIHPLRWLRRWFAGSRSAANGVSS